MNILERDYVLETCGNSLLRYHTVCSNGLLILDQFLKLLAWFEAWRKWFVVGWVVLPLRFDLSQALCVPSGFPGLQEGSCCAGVILV